MDAKTYVNYRTSNIIQKIDAAKIPLGKTKNRQNGLKSNKNLSGMDSVFFNTKAAGRFDLMVYQKSSIRIDIVDGFLPQDIVDVINDGARLQIRDGIYTYNGNVHFSVEAIPSLGRFDLKEVKAENNDMSFGDYHYFKYVSKSGQEYYMHVGKYKGFGMAMSESMRGTAYSEDVLRYISFWNGMMSVTGPWVPGEKFTRSDIKSYLEDAGIQPGFFTINMKYEGKAFFYSQGEYSSIVIRKSDYDRKYNDLTRPCNEFTTGLLRDYEPGSVIKVGGKEYVLSEDHTLDLPYGADIYDMELPKIPL